MPELMQNYWIYVKVHSPRLASALACAPGTTAGVFYIQIVTPRAQKNTSCTRIGPCPLVSVLVERKQNVAIELHVGVSRLEDGAYL